MTIQHSVDLRSFNSFGVVAYAEHFVVVDSVDDLRQAFAWAKQNNADVRILGGGSNILLTGDVKGLVIHIAIHGMEASIEGDTVTIKCGAGESWHHIVTWTVQNGWGGLENLALIPGTVGAAPMQNIGAYGVEQASRFYELEAYDPVSDSVRTFGIDDCGFGYRDSVFKHEECRIFVIISVSYRLSTTPNIVADYRDIVDELSARQISQPGIIDVFDAVVAIRTRKLPDPQIIGNAGSFFKNPAVSALKYKELAEQYPGMPSYAQLGGSVKLAAAWLIDQCGWKGYRSGDVGVHERQALVLVNHGGGSGAELLSLAREIQSSVLERFDVTLEQEVNSW